MSLFKRKITELFLNAGRNRDAIQKNRLTKDLADLSLKRERAKIAHQKVIARIDRQIEITKGKLHKL